MMWAEREKARGDEHDQASSFMIARAEIFWGLGDIEIRVNNIPFNLRLAEFNNRNFRKNNEKNARDGIRTQELLRD